MSLGSYSTNANNGAWALSQGTSANQVGQSQINAGWYGTPYWGNGQGSYRGPNANYGGGGYGGAGASYGSSGGYGGPGASYGAGGLSGTSGSGSAAGGASGTGTNNYNTNGAYTTSIDAGPIWSDDQVQGAVNQGRATNANQTQQAGQSLSQGLAARGFGAGGGGLGAALRGALSSNSAAQQAQGEQQLRYNAAQGNAQQNLASQTARANEGLGLGGMLLQQRQQDTSLANANQQNILGLMMSAFGGLNGSS